MFYNSDELNTIMVSDLHMLSHEHIDKAAEQFKDEMYETIALGWNNSDVVADNWEENIQEDDKMHIATLDNELEGKFKIEPVDNGGIVTVNVGDKETKIKGEFVDDTVAEAVNQVATMVKDEEYEKEIKECEIERKEQRIEQLQEELEELKG